MVSTPSGEVRKWNAKKTKLVGLVSAVAIAATPGVYSAWESAKQAYQAKQEQKVNDKQNIDLQKFVKALEVEVAALRKSMVTHKDLVDLLFKLREQGHRRRAPARPDQELDEKIKVLKEKAAKADAAAKVATTVKKALPALKSPAETRQLVKQSSE